MYLDSNIIFNYLIDELIIKECLTDPETILETFDSLLRNFELMDEEGYLKEQYRDAFLDGYKLFRNETLKAAKIDEEDITEEDFKMADLTVTEILNHRKKVSKTKKDTNVTYVTIPFSDGTILDYDTGSSVKVPKGFKAPNGKLDLTSTIPGPSGKKTYEFLLNELSGNGGLEARTKYVKQKHNVESSHPKRLRSEGSCYVLKDRDATTRMPFIVHYDNKTDKTYIIVLGFLRKLGQNDPDVQNQYDLRAEYVRKLIETGNFDFDEAEKAYNV